MKKLLVTGSSGLIGSEVCCYFAERDWEVHGLDNNMRAVFFGPDGDTRWNEQRLLSELSNFSHHEIDIRDRIAVLDLLESLKPDAIVHAAAQPSHDLAAQMPFEDFDTNAVGTMNLLESTRRFVPDTPFVFLSTNKVYGDGPNALERREGELRYDYAEPKYQHGIDESFPLDHCTHSLFGVSKLAADIMVQEYGRYFQMKTCCLRGGCLTGPNHSGVELHGFLSYLVKCNLSRQTYTIYGYKGKQVRDNLHSLDVSRFVEQFIASPRSGEVYNMGGGTDNSCSILEAFGRISEISGLEMNYEYSDRNRIGDHVCYISDLRKMKSHYPEWDISVSLDDIFAEIYQGWQQRLSKV